MTVFESGVVATRDDRAKVGVMRVEGDTFTEWARAAVGPMARLVSRIAPNVDRDDVVQDALQRGWLKRHQFDPARGTPTNWLLGIAADQARQATRRQRRTAAQRAQGPTETHASHAGASIDNTADLLDLESALATLSERQQLAIACAYYLQLTMAETAEVMGCTTGTVKSTLHDARQRLATQLGVSP